MLDNVTSFTFYLPDYQDRFVINKIGIKGNRFSESEPDFGKWRVTKNPGMGGSRYLVNSTRHFGEPQAWLSTLVHSRLVSEANISFDTAEEALTQLKNVVGEVV